MGPPVKGNSRGPAPNNETDRGQQKLKKKKKYPENKAGTHIGYGLALTYFQLSENTQSITPEIHTQLFMAGLQQTPPFRGLTHVLPTTGKRLTCGMPIGPLPPLLPETTRASPDRSERAPSRRTDLQTEMRST